MANLVNHGAACCGVRHIYGMDNTTVAELERHIATVDAIPVNGGSATSGRLIEIILSSRQVGEPNPRGGTGNRWAPCVTREGGWPAVLQRLGFRLVSRFENKNSGADCYIFHRVPHFKALDDLAFNWDFDRNEVNTAAGGPGPMAPVAHNREGQRVRYTYHANTRVPQGTLGTIIERTVAGNYRVNWDNGHITGADGHMATYIEHAPDAPLAPVPVTVVARLWQNVFADGRRGGMYPLIGAAREAAPRCRRIDEVQYRSDGTTNIIANVG